jgi:hypothetical protein
MPVSHNCSEIAFLPERLGEQAPDHPRFAQKFKENAAATN